MLAAPSPTSVALLLGLSFFLGLAFEDFFAQVPQRPPGGIRTFPMLALAGGMLYLLEPAHGIAFTAGLFVLGAWLVMYYRTHLAELHRAAHRHEGDRHRRPVSGPDRDRAAAVAQRAGDGADQHHAAPGLAGAGGGRHVFLRELSG